jgi:hypothetical protein
MGLSNAENQARWRERRQAEIEHLRKENAALKAALESEPVRRERSSAKVDATDRDLIEMHPDAVTAEQRWQWSAANLFGDVVAAAAFWRREFGDWQKFRPPTELIALMDQAADAMQQLRAAALR